MPSGGKGGGGPSGTTTTNVQPWSGQQPYLLEAFQNAQNLFQNNTPQYFPGATYAGENPMQQAGLSGIFGLGSSDLLPQDVAAQNGAITSGAYLFNNPAFPALSTYLSGARIGADNPYTDQLTSDVLSRVVPQTQSSFIEGGTLSSPEAARATAAGATSAISPYLFQQQQQEEQNQIQAANLASGAWESGLNDMLRGIALAPQSDALQYSPYQMMLGAGTTQQQLDQQGINDQVNRWNWQQELPYDQLNAFLSEIGGTGYGSSTTTPYFGSGGSNMLGGLFGGASLGNMLFPAAAGGTAYGALGGGLLGALFGLSDRRSKTDIEPVGELDNGLTVYSYRYKDEPEEMRRIGLMADEVEKEHPEAVSTLPHTFGSLAGLKVVDYAQAIH